MSYAISIHALLAESDLPTWDLYQMLRISIHALLAESDYFWYCAARCSCFYFYPRSPCGERQIFHYRTHMLFLFLSTLSLRRATHNTKNNCIDCCISIHALLAESDPGLSGE